MTKPAGYALHIDKTVRKQLVQANPFEPGFDPLNK